MTKILLVGCGKMGSALLSGWLDRGISKADVVVVDPSLPDLGVAVVAAESLTVVPSGHVWCKTGGTATVQPAAIAAWNAYLASIPIGGETGIALTYGHSGVVRCSKLDEILMNAGAYETSDLQLNGAGVDIDLQITATQVPASVLGVLDPAMVWAEV